MKRYLIGIIAVASTIVFIGCPAVVPSPPPATTTTTQSSTTSTSTSVPSSGTYTIQPSGGDDAAALVSAVKTHATVIVNKPLLVNGVANFGNASNKRITFQGNGKLVRTIEPTSRTHQVMVFVGGSNVILDNPIIEGPGGVCDVLRDPPVPGLPDLISVGYYAKWEAQHGIELGNVKDFTINGGSIKNVHGDGVYIGAAGGGIASQRITINNLSTRCTGRSSITNILSENTTINGGSFVLSGLWIFNIEPVFAQYVHDYMINHPVVGYSNFQWLFVSGPYFSCDVKRVVFNQPNLVNSSAGSRPPTLAGCIAGNVLIN